MSNRKIDPTKIHFDENTTVEVADLENEEYYVEGERLTKERAEQLAAEMLARVRAKNVECNHLPVKRPCSPANSHGVHCHGSGL